MAHSLSAECTPLKLEYDSCFNAWFEGYLEPAIAASSSQQQQADYSKRKADEFQQKCGKVWENYRACVQVRSLMLGIHFYTEVCIEQKAVKAEGLDTLLDQARQEHPLKEPTSSAPPSKPPTS